MSGTSSTQPAQTEAAPLTPEQRKAYEEIGAALPAHQSLEEQVWRMRADGWQVSAARVVRLLDYLTPWQRQAYERGETVYIEDAMKNALADCATLVLPAGRFDVGTSTMKKEQPKLDAAIRAAIQKGTP